MDTLASTRSPRRYSPYLLAPAPTLGASNSRGSPSAGAPCWRGVVLQLCHSVAGALASACATPATKREPSQFKKWPSKPPDCDFDIFEENFEPSRPYEVLGSADVVMLSYPSERLMGQERIRTYEARYAVYTDVPPPPEVLAEREAANKPPPPPPPIPGTVVIPSSEWTEDVEGTSITQEKSATQEK
ncbi:hypothetical protein F0U61_49745 [Archangium violaceum]|uniref:hypothetical protein n=1 Tax=Archangium violaceum TaxID=83451 RepID=UPI002B2BBD48|nr:hypothetical protein F0U61_49745 [Archangium violaceum]